MNMNKTSKKVSTLAATVAVATAFCGLCAGVATTVKAEAKPATAPVQTSAANDYKVILAPGWNFESGVKKLNTIDDAGVTAITAEQSKTNKYYVENAYECKLTEGENLPKPKAGRTGLTFVGWRYTKDGETFTVEKVPSAANGNVYLYADWTAGTTSSGGGSGEIVTPIPGSVTVNGKTMAKNPTPSEQDVSEEYMLEGVTLEANTPLVFNVNGSAVTISSVGNSPVTDIVKTGSSISTGSKGGSYNLYLKHKKDGSWEIYGARNVDGGVVATEGNIYLAGVVDDRDLNWNSWPESGTKKGILVSGGTITIKLTKGDNCKFVKYSATSSNMKWQKSLTGAGSSISFANENANMIVNETGTYTFTITEGTDRLNVSVTKA